MLNFKRTRAVFILVKSLSAVHVTGDINKYRVTQFRSVKTWVSSFSGFVKKLIEAKTLREYPHAWFFSVIHVGKSGIFGLF